MNSIRKLSAGVVALALFGCATNSVREEDAKSSKWETVRHQGNDYVTLRSLKKFYGFDRMKREGSQVVLENRAVKMRVAIGSREVWMNNVKFVCSQPIVRHQERYLVSRIDLAKLIDPVLRPSYISKEPGPRVVIIDPGRGGSDGGARNAHGKEKDYTLAVGRKLKAELERRNFEVVMTRESDRDVSSRERVRLANRHKKAVFISLHFSADASRRAEGIGTFTLSPAGSGQVRRGNAQDSANIALATAVHSNVIARTGRRDRGIRRARTRVLSDLKHPAVLVEGGFMTHPVEARLIGTTAYQDTLAEAIANGVVKFQARDRKAGSQAARIR